MTCTSHSDNTEHFISEWDRWRPFFLVAVLLRLLFTATASYSIDMGGYLAWSRHLAINGPETLYETFHVVYAPLYHYLLWLTGEIALFTGMDGALHTWLIKSWAVLADAVGTLLLIRLGWRQGNLKAGFVLGLLYWLNPAVLFNSSVWGQFDGIPGLMLVGVLLLFADKKPVAGALFFVAAVLVKPQSGLLAPLVLIAWVRLLIGSGWKNGWTRAAATILGSLCIYLAVVLPFYQPTSLSGQLPRVLDPFWWLFELYLTSVQDYPYATANAWNFWYLAGGQIQPDNLLRGWFSYATWGYLLMLPILVLVLITGFRRHASSQSLLEGGWILLFAAYVLMTRMHERYLVPALLLGTVCALKDRRWLPPLLLASGVSALNQAVLYRMSFQKNYWLTVNDALSFSGSALMLLAFLWALGLSVASLHCQSKHRSMCTTSVSNEERDHVS